MPGLYSTVSPVPTLGLVWNRKLINPCWLSKWQSDLGWALNPSSAGALGTAVRGYDWQLRRTEPRIQPGEGGCSTMAECPLAGLAGGEDSWKGLLTFLLLSASLAARRGYLHPVGICHSGPESESTSPFATLVVMTWWPWRLPHDGGEPEHSPGLSHEKEVSFSCFQLLQFGVPYPTVALLTWLSPLCITQKVLDEYVVELPSEEDLFIPANIKGTGYVPYFPRRC